LHKKTLISHFASASGGLCSPDPLLGICTIPYWGPKFHPFYTIPDPPSVNPLHCEILGMQMVKPIPITIPSRLLAVAHPDILG